MGLLDGLASTVGGLLTQFGQRATYRATTAGAYDPVTGGTAPDTVREIVVPAMVEEYPLSLAISGSALEDGVRRGDKKVTVAATAFSEDEGIAGPAAGDEVQIGGEWFNSGSPSQSGGQWYRIVSVDAQYGTEQVLYYVLQCRR